MSFSGVVKHCAWIVSIAFSLLGTYSAAGQSINGFFKTELGENNSVGFHPWQAARTDTTRLAKGAAVITRYYASGKKQEEIPYSNLRKGMLHGTYRRWFESGQIYTEEGFVAGKRQGKVLVYSANGVLRRQEEFKLGKRMVSQCFDAAGKSTSWIPFMQLPEYPGGINALLEAIRSATVYPANSLRDGEQGKSMVSFTISSRGQVVNARVVKSVSPTLDAEALRVVKMLHGWAPGKLDGKPASADFTVPVTFQIQ
ncbi:energy transducer TonB [Hymenobacter guriensis]|uniref:TonB family protein n=1 Tax=Hymenobacter guriensis TaxID=2793065 RepID=A0ABS0L3Z4_9BACT|nr:energy transducer TonB [Hymenobacter guriensis]MBG8554796.1 TonB family protein [Hymenobacter guriensis]